MPLVLFAVTRLGVAAVAYLAAPLIHDSTTPPPYHLRGTDNLLLDAFASRWDTGFYISIVEEGYRLYDVELPSVAFFPLYPMLMKGLTFVVGDAAVAGLLISNGALLLAALVFYRLVEEGWGEPVADRAVWFLLIFPSSVFGSAVYTESLFLLIAIGAFLLARRGRWLGAGLLGVASALTRLHGLVVGAMLAVEWWHQRRSRPPAERPAWTALGAAAVTPLGTLAYVVYCWKAFGEPLAFVKGASAWGRVAQSPYETMAEVFKAPGEGWWTALLGGRLHLDNWLDFLFVAGFLVLGCLLLSLRRWSEGAFVVLGVSLSFSSGLLMSQRRYVWVLFPVFILLAQWGRRAWVERTVTAFSLLGLALFTVLFVNGYWVG